MLWKLASIFFILFCLISCQTPNLFIADNVIPADIIIENAHGGGSVIEFNKQETILASAGWSGYVRLWNIPDGTKHIAWKAHKGEVTGVQFADNDRLIVSSGYDGYIKIWSAISGQLLKKINSLQSIRSMVVNEQRDLIITGHSNGRVKTWRLKSLSPLKQRKQHNSPVRAVAYSAYNGIIASSGSSTVMLWPDNAPSITLSSPFSAIRTLQFNKNGQILLGGGWFNLYRWTLSDEKLQVLDTEHRGIIRNMSLLDNDTTLATISRQTDSAVLFLNPQTGAVKQRFQSHDLCGADISVSEHQKYMATTSDDASVRIWWLNKLPNNKTFRPNPDELDKSLIQ